MSSPQTGKARLYLFEIVIYEIFSTISKSTQNSSKFGITVSQEHVRMLYTVNTNNSTIS